MSEVCERLNGILGDSVRKILADNCCSVDIALAWDVSARNSLSNNLGYSLSQLLYGENSNLPNVFENNPSALENRLTSDIDRDNSLMQGARRSTHGTALRPSKDTEISSGDRVYYKRKYSKE